MHLNIYLITNNFKNPKHEALQSRKDQIEVIMFYL